MRWKVFVWENIGHKNASGKHASQAINNDLIGFVENCSDENWRNVVNIIIRNGGEHFASVKAATGT